MVNMEKGRFYVNNATFEGSDVPVMLQIMSGMGTAGELLPLGSVIKLPRGKVVEVRIRGTTRLSGGPVSVFV